jgi:hypothetical protein
VLQAGFLLDVLLALKVEAKYSYFPEKSDDFQWIPSAVSQKVEL